MQENWGSLGYGGEQVWSSPHTANGALHISPAQFRLWDTQNMEQMPTVAVHPPFPDQFHDRSLAILPPDGKYLGPACKFPVQRESGSETFGASASPNCSISWLMGSSNIDTVLIGLIATFAR